MTFYVEYSIDDKLPFEVKEVCEKVATAILENERCDYASEVNLMIMDNQGIREINKEHRSIDEATDVLSFPNVTFENPSDFNIVETNKMDYFNPETEELILGDIIISIEKVREQALSYGHSELREFAFLVAHSMLHLCGYDHMELDEMKVMEEKQEYILNMLGITRD
ncbi:MAG TPA: rRNA maturation RNase YbeY [Lachnospiraceae bacterium]|nr:rRNA maturation RNase YbeY [Lachnospiraceae bacterium]